MQGSPPQLTFNGILYLTLGFKQHYLLQVLAVDSHQKDLHLVLYDGVTYIGATYRTSTLNNNNQIYIPHNSSHQRNKD